jgi:hypothetical protein
MPSLYDQVATYGLQNIEDVNKFAHLPFYLVKNEIKKNEHWNTWDQLFGSIPWKPNMGPIMRSARPEYSPIAQTFFYPLTIQQEPNKNVYEVSEALEQARLRWQDYDTANFTFLPSFQDFWQNQVKFKSDDMSRQIQISNNMFIRTVAWQVTPYVLFAGNPDLQTAPYDAEGMDDRKSAAWRGANVQNITSGLTLSVMSRALSTIIEDLDAPPFEGTYNTVADNEQIKGKWVLVTSTEMYNNWTFDPLTETKGSVNLDLVFNGFHGSLWGQLTCKFDKYPIRFNDAGAVVNPQVELDQTAQTRGVQPIVNPNYASLTAAPYEVAFLMGADFVKTIGVGAPPKEFVNKDISAKKLYEMNWNGKVFITDQVLKTITDGNGFVTAVDTNARGRLLKLIATTIHGALPGQPRSCIPILFRRQRAPISQNP